MRVGRIVRPEITVALLFERMNQYMNDPNVKGFIIDGFPRQLDQLDYILKYADYEHMYLLNLMCSDENVYARLQYRSQVEKVERIDNTMECLKYRLKNFQEETSKVYKEFQQHNRFTEIDANGPKETVRQLAIEKVKELIQ